MCAEKARCSRGDPDRHRRRARRSHGKLDRHVRGRKRIRAPRAFLVFCYVFSPPLFLFRGARMPRPERSICLKQAEKNDTKETKREAQTTHLLHQDLDRRRRQARWSHWRLDRRGRQTL